ncbi:hypothetical protein M413DRAFT_442975 [Hebeloma cylindrosporum]|uniref:Uncharacterized protein n=1 Tax=Hebeloma cylindrosporum TaxID=76867 RepID=A0A0C2Y219_HEBCY|nr:hypothetical protein M413DRAFT_442975 [Hebeloma cylindrosporum h7]
MRIYALDLRWDAPKSLPTSPETRAHLDQVILYSPTMIPENIASSNPNHLCSSLQALELSTLMHGDR